MGGYATRLWTSLPGIIQSFDAVKLTAVVQPAIQGIIQQQDGSTKAVNMPLLLDCPVVFPRGGNCTLTFPITAGDECLVIFSARCIDSWWQNGGTSNIPMEPRMHDLSDGFCLPGPFSQKTKISNVSTSTVQLRSNDGNTYVELDPAGSVVHVKASTMTIDANVTINGDVTLNGKETATGTITSNSDVKTGSISLKNHIHTDPQGGTTGVPQ
jgi:hypothetical protein